jgi:hypothetical protein
MTEIAALQNEAPHTNLLGNYASKNSKVPGIFKLKAFCNIFVKMEAYGSQNRFTQC